ncbi:hypothetical protein BDW02DRAFT_510913 [Decorospora gaudefroyi]|uniref:RING-type domain-containing protein n=1 Tax=Decorospora gaudefroyi TaxID=184978 RepID=A0A6A5K354_9PLEO|nr:hypothetical protein BDW02DRAFT_510913 [Decorospora gaudefroyi]
MPSLSKNKNEHVFVRHKRTGDIDIRLANELSPRPRYSPLRGLHYIGAARTHVCRCSNPKSHYEKTFDIASESTHLNASLTLYMDRHHLESCTIADYQKYLERQKAQWVKHGVRVADFHYVSKNKDVVCRCRTPQHHDCGAPRNPEIVEQCAGFFCNYHNKLTVGKEQWKRVNGDLPPAYDSGLQSQQAHPRPGTAGSPRSLFDRSPLSPEMEMRSTAERVAPVEPTPSRHRSESIPQAQPEIPPQLWQKARPSLWVPQDDTGSALSTPIGTAFPESPVGPAVPVKIPLDNRTTTLEFSPRLQRISTATYWSRIQRDAGVSDEETSPETPRAPAPRSDSAYDMTAVQRSLNDICELPTGSFSRPHASMAEAMMGDADGTFRGPIRTPLAELPSRNSAVELLAQPPRQRDTPTLKCLEGRDWDTMSELEARGRRCTIRVEKTPKRTSTSTTKSSCLSSLFEQVLGIAESTLPDQEEFLLRHAILSSRTNPAPAGNCQLCDEPYQDGRKRTVMLPDCGHFLHEQCLLDNLRALDQQFGRCPVCQFTLCERTLADRIDTDREAIFGPQFTPLRNEVSIAFPQRSQAVKCLSEEEVAAAQLRLIKDYVDVHTEELFRLWEATRAEPDWFASVVRPVVKLFQGWNPATRHTQFFADREAFLKLVVWAELVRLMNTTRVTVKKTQGERAMFPQLAELHRKFMMASDRYHKEKKTWQTNRSGVLGCEKIALDAVKTAMDTHIP